MLCGALLYVKRGGNYNKEDYYILRNIFAGQQIADFPVLPATLGVHFLQAPHQVAKTFMYFRTIIKPLTRAIVLVTV